MVLCVNGCDNNDLKHTLSDLLNMKKLSMKWKTWKCQPKCKYWDSCCWCCRRGWNVFFILNSRWLLDARDFFFCVLTIHPKLGRHKWLVNVQRHFVVIELVEHFVAEEISDSILLESCVHLNRLHSPPNSGNFSGIFMFLIVINPKFIVNSVKIKLLMSEQFGILFF